MRFSRINAGERRPLTSSRSLARDPGEPCRGNAKVHDARWACGRPFSRCTSIRSESVDMRHGISCVKEPVRRGPLLPLRGSPVLDTANVLEPRGCDSLAVGTGHAVEFLVDPRVAIAGAAATKPETNNRSRKPDTEEGDLQARFGSRRLRADQSEVFESAQLQHSWSQHAEC